MLQTPTPAAETARAKLRQPHARLTLDECRAIVGDDTVDHGALGRASSEQISAALFAICGPLRPKIGGAA